jgi:hypothetical protein
MFYIVLVKNLPVRSSDIPVSLATCSAVMGTCSFLTKTSINLSSVQLSRQPIADARCVEEVVSYIS